MASGRLDSEVRLPPLVQWMAARGLTGADLAVKGEFLVIKLPTESRGRLLQESALRDEIVARGKALGFSRVVLEITAE